MSQTSTRQTSAGIPTFTPVLLFVRHRRHSHRRSRVRASPRYHEDRFHVFRFELNGASSEGLTFEAIRSTGEKEIRESDGDTIASGRTGALAVSAEGVEATSGLASDLCAGDAHASGEIRRSLATLATIHPRSPAIHQRGRRAPGSAGCAMYALAESNPIASAAGAAIPSDFLTTLTLFVTTPGVPKSRAGGFPAISAAIGQFLLKDVALLAASPSLLLASVRQPASAGGSGLTGGRTGRIASRAHRSRAGERHLRLSPGRSTLGGQPIYAINGRGDRVIRAGNQCW